MSASVPPPVTEATLGPQLSDSEFELFQGLVRAETGIALGASKRHLLRARLDRRLRALGLSSFREYYAYLTDHGHPHEIEAFVNAVTTNKTDFFREAHHFHYLAERWAAERADVAPGARSRLRVWSAACSTGEEAYTIAIVLNEARLVPPASDVRILATDIDTAVLDEASQGVYSIQRVQAIPRPLLTRYFLRSTDGGERVRVRPELRDLIAFRRLNLAEGPWPFRGKFDVIFCRNVLIYFDRATQVAILERLVDVLSPTGLLFLGHSESVFGLRDDLIHLGNTIYTRRPVIGRGERG